MRVRLEGLTFVGGEGRAELDIERAGITGWFGGSSVRSEKLDRPDAHGTFPSRVRRGGRLIVLNGHVWSSSPSEQEHLFDRLTGLLGEGEIGRLHVDTESGTKWADVQLDDEVEITQQVYGKFADYRIQLWARDPLRYGDTRFTGGGVAAVNYGNANAFPVITVSGSAANYTVNAAGKSFVVSKAITPGQSHVIEMKTGN